MCGAGAQEPRVRGSGPGLRGLSQIKRLMLIPVPQDEMRKLKSGQGFGSEGPRVDLELRDPPQWAIGPPARHGLGYGGSRRPQL